MNATIETKNGSAIEPVSSLVVEQEIIMHISEISKNSRTTFFALIIAWVYSYLAISTTSDAALLTNSGATPLPIIQVRVPIVWFYYFAPVILAVLFFYFHFYLESFWRSVIRLPLFHPEDGRGLDDYVYPWLISTTFIRGGNPKLARNRTLSRLEYGLSLFLGWWIIPLILLFYWARYLVAHEWGGTILHSGLFLLTVCFAFRFYYQAKNAVMAIPDNSESGNIKAPDEKEALRCKPVQIVTGVVSTLILGGMMAYLSLSAIYGLPADICRDMAKTKICRFFIPGTVLLNVAGIKSFADIKEKKLVPKPEKWQELLDEPIALRRYLETQSNLKLSERNLRHLNAEGAFLPASFLDRVTLDHAELQHAVLTLSKLVDVSFHGANLTHVDFQHARISGTKFDNVFADVSRFNHARFITGETGEQTLFNGEYYDAWFEHCDGDSLLFIDANLRETHFKNAKIRYSIFQRVDLAGATFEDADLLANKFYQADFTNAELRTADLSDCTFEECKFISTIIKGTTFEDAKFINSLFDFSEAISAGTQSNAMRNVVDSFNGFGVEFRNSHINNTHFTNTDLRFAQFKAVSFINTRFSDTDLSDATFIDTDLSGVEFERVDFSGADLKNVTGLTATHLENMCGNKETKLPKGFEGLQPCIMLNHP